MNTRSGYAARVFAGLEHDVRIFQQPPCVLQAVVNPDIDVYYVQASASDEIAIIAFAAFCVVFLIF